MGGGGRVQDLIKSLLKPWASHTIKSKSHVEYEARMEEPGSPEKKKALNSEQRFFPVQGNMV